MVGALEFVLLFLFYFVSLTKQKRERYSHRTDKTRYAEGGTSSFLFLQFFGGFFGCHFTGVRCHGTAGKGILPTDLENSASSVF